MLEEVGHSYSMLGEGCTHAGKCMPLIVEEFERIRDCSSATDQFT
jgi:hypothetical protein